MNKKIIIANWKMLPESWAEAEQILGTIDENLSFLKKENYTLVLCPPFIFLEEVNKILKISRLGNKTSLGAQDIFWEDTGNDTGEISGPMLKNLGVSYVIVGHSERRWKLGESNEVVNKKLKSVLRNEMIPIVCLGENVRDENFKMFLREQIKNTFEGLSRDELEKCIIAYEPVWAISSNSGATPDNPEESAKVIKIIREEINSLGENELWMPVLYGGSINSKNSGDFLEQKEINGVLIGGASVDKEEFFKILSLIK